MDGVDGKVSYFLNKVTYTQTVEVSNNTTIKGKHTYQVCDESQCLAPKTKNFSFEIKDLKIDDTISAATIVPPVDTTSLSQTTVDTALATDNIIKTDTIAKAIQESEGNKTAEKKIFVMVVLRSTCWWFSCGIDAVCLFHDSYYC